MQTRLRDRRTRDAGLLYRHGVRLDEGEGASELVRHQAVQLLDGFLTPELIAECDGYFAAGEKKLAATDDERAKGELALEKAFWIKWRAAAEKKKPAASKKPKKVRLDGMGKPLQD